MKSTFHRMNLVCGKSIFAWFVICLFDKSFVVNFWDDYLIIVRSMDYSRDISTIFLFVLIINIKQWTFVNFFIHSHSHVIQH